MSFLSKNPRLATYLIMGATMALIFIIWLVVLVHRLSTPAPSAPTATSQEMTTLRQKFSQMANELKVLKNNLLEQAATTTTETVQGGLKIKPEELDEIVERLELPTTTAPTTTQLK